MSADKHSRKVSDFRSDTVTQPTREMRRAMAEADVGDDVYGEDPTINRLQEEAAAIFGREAALFVPSGTMANQIAVKHFTQPGEEVVVEASSHTLLFEGGGLGLISGVQAHPVPGMRGIMDPDQIMAAVHRDDDVHLPRTGLVVIENTHNFGGGTVLSLDYVRQVAERVHDVGLPLYIDGARIFNACAAAGVPVSRYAAHVDLISCCLSKGLGAPVGSLLIGDKERIQDCHRLRKPFGGSMRQAGILAAAGLIALREGPRLLIDDHRRARCLADGIAPLPGIELDPGQVQTNIIMARTTQGRAPSIAEALAAEGVLIHALSGDALRFVTHRDVDDADVARALTAMQKATAGGAAG